MHRVCDCVQTRNDLGRQVQQRQRTIYQRETGKEGATLCLQKRPCGRFDYLYSRVAESQALQKNLQHPNEIYS
jgi:hypothetical protein